MRYPLGKDFFMYSDGSDSIASRVFFGSAMGFEEATSKVLTKYFKTGGAFFDVGANSGIYSLMAATFPQTKEIHSFEPMATAFGILQNNVEKNNFHNVRLNRLALGDHEGVLELAVPKGIMLPTGSSAMGSAKFDNSDQMLSEKIRLTTLDHYVESKGIQSCDLIKIDTETTEPAVIRGALKTIARFRPKIVCEVIRDQAAHEIEALLRGLDYKYYHLTNEGPVPVTSIRPNQSLLNFLFLPKEVSLDA
ncbi:MAG: FkbM family methyltransferase [Bdellovibrionales bacterium]|nr:FkbM family methyltransferase [Bdellovibrionales bacterium]